MKKALLHIIILAHCCVANAQFNFIEPNSYVCRKTSSPIQIDGLANEASWGNAPWSSDFVDIEGNKNPNPYLKTRVKMLWDETYFYFYVEMEEPHVWANLTQRDAVIFHDNDFEIFIDPDGDTHNYYEFEINALNTVWDLLLTRPYRDGGLAIDHWDIHGLKTAIHINGTLNNPNDRDSGWSVEVAMPWEVLGEATRMSVPPSTGDQWRLNFSRVEWETEIVDGQYVKKKNQETGKNLPENNWVWSPQRAIAMHEPEFWGRVFFAEITNRDKFVEFGMDQASEKVTQALFEIHRAQLEYKKTNGTFSNDKTTLFPHTSISSNERVEWELEAGKNYYHAKMKRPYTTNVYWYIDETGRIWKETINE